MSNEILCPLCPVCGQPPVMGFALAQWFCGTDGCVVLCWDPYDTLEANLTNATPAVITERGED